jgi:acetyl-CoA carboxylase carboxyltransferase component
MQEVKNQMIELIEDLEQRKEHAKQMGGKERVEKQHSLGRMTARERVDALLDPDSFFEVGILNHSDIPGKELSSAADGLVCGLGKINGRTIAVQAIDKTVLAGSEGKVHMRKTEALHTYAAKKGFPIFTLGEGGGLRMPDGMGSDGISDKMMPMHLLKHERKVPTFTNIMGESFGGASWIAAVSDIVIQVKGTCMAVAGPRMLEVATGEKLTPEELGGWQIHAEHTGQVDFFAENEEDSLEKMKHAFSFFPSHAQEEPPFRPTLDDPYRRLDEVVNLVPTKRTRAYDMSKLIRLILDDHQFTEINPLFGRALIVGFGHLNGRTVGIVANQPMRNAGAAGPEECEKATEFICLCDSWNIPMVFLHDIPGFRVGSAAEKRKMPTKVMVWNQAIAWSTVPKISVVIRKSIGAAYGNMCGPMMGADFVVAWPTAEINFTGPEVGINVVYGNKLKESENAAEERKELLKLWEFDSAPYKAAGKHMIDDIIDPRDTRKFLCQSLEFACSKNGSKGERLLANWPTGF